MLNKIEEICTQLKDCYSQSELSRLTLELLNIPVSDVEYTLIEKDVVNSILVAEYNIARRQ